MFYSFDISTPSLTPESNPQLTVLEMEMGVVTQVVISFPPGSEGLLHMQLWKELNQVYPRNPGEDINGDWITLDFREHLELVMPSHRLLVYTWNEDDTYAHKLQLRINLFQSQQLRLPPEDEEEEAEEDDEEFRALSAAFSELRVI